LVSTLEKNQKEKSKRRKLEGGKTMQMQNDEEEESDWEEDGEEEKISVGEDGENEKAKEEKREKEMQNKMEQMKKRNEEKKSEIQRIVDTPVRSGEEDDQESIDAKRKITTKMEKNISLRKKTKKQIKNPRVKHKLKYKKALVRRSGQVQKMRDKTKKYQGEKTGIKTNVIKSTPL